MEQILEAPNDKQKEKKQRTESSIKAYKKYYEKTRAEHIARAIKWHSEKYDEIKNTEKHKETRKRLNKKYYQNRKERFKQQQEQEKEKEQERNTKEQQTEEN